MPPVDLVACCNMADDTLERLQAFATQDVRDTGSLAIQWNGERGDWLFAAEWGQEAPDSPMAGAATYGNDAEVTACIEEALADLSRHKAKTPVQGTALIAAERARQQAQWSTDHDDSHDQAELVRAAVCYAEQAGCDIELSAPLTWPWQDREWHPSGDRVKDLVKAGALIAAEIDRLQRAAAS